MTMMIKEKWKGEEKIVWGPVLTEMTMMIKEKWKGQEKTVGSHIDIDDYDD